MSPKRIGRRAIFLLSFVTAAFLVIGWRFWELQIVHGNHYQTLAEQDQLRKIPIPAPRGNIVTADGVTVATSKPVWSLYYLNQGDALPSTEVNLLSHYLDIPAATLTKQIAQQLVELPSYQPIEIDSSLTARQMTVIEENINQLPYLRIQPTAIRYDPYGTIMGNVIGYLDEETSTTDTGASGLEYEYNNYLTGHSGGEYAEVNRQGQLVKLFGHEVPKPGNTLHLTINWNLEKTAYDALSYDMYAMRHASPSLTAYSPTAEQGGVIAINPDNGDILAIASLPSYNPNKLLPNSSTRSSYYNQENLNPLHPLSLFVPIGELFSPGSIFKPIIATGALASGTVTPTSEIYDPGYFPKDPAFHSWEYPNAFGWLNIEQAIGLSDDTFFYTLGYDMGINLMDKWFNKFLLNKLTGIDLPGEVKSIPPSPKQLSADGDGTWTWGWNLNTAIGQGIDQFTMIALARADSAIANGGTLYQPHLVSEITNPSGKVVKTINPVIQGKINVPSSVWSTIHTGMEMSAQNRDIANTGTSGTGYGALAGFPISLASKTGTAQVNGNANNAFFLTYGPMPNPKILIIVYVKAGNWGADSGFVARAIYDQYFKVKDPTAQPLFDSTFGKPSTWPFGYTAPTPKGP